MSAEKSEIARQLEGLLRAVEADEGPWKKVPNRADRRRWGVRGRPPLAGAFRAPRTRPVRGIDPTPVSRPSTRLHGRACYGQRRIRASVRRWAAARQSREQLAAQVLTHGHPTPHDLATLKEPTA